MISGQPGGTGGRNGTETDGTEKTAIVVMGVSGSGKTTIARLLGKRLGWQVAEADEFHSQANVDKMSAGTPLSDADRKPWLESIRDWISAADGNVVLTCSALRRGYRDTLSDANARVRFLHLDGTRDLIGNRIQARTDHFMPPALLGSQLSTLEPLDPDEDGVVVTVDGTPAEIADRALAALDLSAPAAD
jgi:gluconokinase